MLHTEFSGVSCALYRFSLVCGNQRASAARRAALCLYGRLVNGARPSACRASVAFTAASMGSTRPPAGSTAGKGASCVARDDAGSHFASALAITVYSKSRLFAQQHMGMPQRPIGSWNSYMPKSMETGFTTSTREDQPFKMTPARVKQEDLFLLGLRPWPQAPHVAGGQALRSSAA